MPPRYCQEMTCSNDLPDNAPRHQKYCSRACRQRHSRRLVSSRVASGQKPKVTKAVKEIRKLANCLGDDTDPAVVFREVLSDAIRDNVTLHVQDNLLGAAEALTNLLPIAIAGLARDLDSNDDYIRQRASAAVMKYSMVFRDTKPDPDKSLGTIQVGVALTMPDTPLGAAVHQEIIEQEDSWQAQLESGTDVGTCSSCKDTFHVNSLHTHPSRPDLQTCSSCRIRAGLAKRQDVAAMFTLDPEFGLPDPPELQEPDTRSRF